MCLRNSLCVKDPATGSYYNPRQPLQELVHDYNVRGWMLGVNRDYLTTAGQTSDGKLFGFELGYDKLTNKTGENFNAAQWNGNIGGMVWKSDGDDTRRKYDYVYDYANRLMRADFEQQNPDNSWNNTKMNFDMKVGDGTVFGTAYDDNGNIKRLQHWGYKLNSVGQIDDLTYNYENKSNRLLNISDAYNDPQTTLGDFRVSPLNPVQTKTATTVDYSYDGNGNLVKDLNKDLVTYAGVNGITYSHLNTPDYITVKRDATSNKGIISYIYDANGVKLKKTVTENPHSSNNNSTIVTTTTYIGPFVYESRNISPADPNRPNYTDRLLYIMHEEGRIRYKPENTSFEYDYTIKDHLGNVRMVLTEELQTNYYPAATLEGTYTASGTPANSMVNHEKNYY
ncbi:MAG: hypothetical protein JNK79_10940, partial [Chitinophagaceae bacterium]|nr:hypothetical protein [Chitinophagaceae bacterium]